MNFVLAGQKYTIQANLYITATFGATKTWPLQTGGRYTETL